jgi:hypothetical protein
VPGYSTDVGDIRLGYILLGIIARSAWWIMNYQPIDKANIVDAARHLEDAQRMRDAVAISAAADVLRQRLELIRISNPKLYGEYTHLLEIQ